MTMPLSAFSFHISDFISDAIAGRVRERRGGLAARQVDIARGGLNDVEPGDRTEQVAVILCGAGGNRVARQDGHRDRRVDQCRLASRRGDHDLIFKAREIEGDGGHVDVRGADRDIGPLGGCETGQPHLDGIGPGLHVAKRVRSPRSGGGDGVGRSSELDGRARDFRGCLVDDSA